MRCRCAAPRSPCCRCRVSPREKFAERRRIFREAAAAAQFARQAAIGIVDEAGQHLGQTIVVVPHAVGAERVHPLQVLHHAPENDGIQPREIAQQHHLAAALTFFDERQTEMMKIDDEVFVTGA